MGRRLVIDRKYFLDCTVSRTHIEGTDFQCFTLELPNLDNAPRISCVPEGTYRAFKRESPSNGPVYQLRDVPGRSYIQGHAGNYTRQILGCQLHGKAVTFLDSDSIPDVTSSKATLSKLLALLPDEFDVVIKS